MNILNKLDFDTQIYIKNIFLDKFKMMKSIAQLMINLKKNSIENFKEINRELDIALSYHSQYFIPTHPYDYYFDFQCEKCGEEYTKYCDLIECHVCEDLMNDFKERVTRFLYLEKSFTAFKENYLGLTLYISKSNLVG